MSIYPKQFYVYMYLREDGTPYYIGKGSGKRAWDNSSRSFKRPTDESRIAIHTDNLTEDQAFSLEIELIAEYGRKDNGTGILRNLTDGGEGHTGAKTDVHKKKISDALRGRKGTKHSEESRRKLSESLTGRRLSEEHKRKIGRANEKPCRDGDGIEYAGIRDAAQAHGISYTSAKTRCQRGYKGWSYI